LQDAPLFNHALFNLVLRCQVSRFQRPD